ncbi:unnamed protein product [Allacma fusca]|uniref:Cilium assembly protein DZIP1 domain-containing protein n=1 Tax=Allacma fusca TaxID=39272 RepID=A0A8J2P380_9HEXA|nr:unnamed protein product [Allacma fusca]
MVTANEIKPENVFKPVIPQLIAVKSRHEYEEPEDVLKFDQVQEYSQSEEEDTTDDLSRNEIIDTEKHPEVGAQSNIPEERLHDPEELSGISKMQAHVTQEVNNQLQALGLDPNAPEISAQDMKRISKQFQARRESVQSRASNFEEQQQVVKPDFQSAAAAVQNNDRLDPRNTAATLEKASRSPLIKVLTAVRTSGMKMHKRVKSAITKTPKRRTSLTLSTLAKPSKESFFSRARWGRKKTPLNVNKEIPPEEKSLEKSSSSSEYTESDESSSESEQDVEVHYIPKEKLPNSKTSTPVKVEPGKIHEIEMSDSVSKPNGNPASRSLQKRKTSTRSQKASTLRNKEAISNKIVGKEKSKQKLELKQEPSFKKPVRRSLDAEFDQATPKKVVEHVSDSLSGDQSTGDEISSSWEEEEGNLDAGAYVHLTPQNNPGERQTRHDPSAIPSNTSEKPFRKDTLSNTGKSGKHQQQMNAAVGKPLTTRPRIALDSWDAVDDDEFQSKPSFENKPTLVSQRWNDEPLYPNTGGRRTPMSMVQTGESTDKSRNSTQQQRKGKHEGKNMRDSPLNNSWDSN